MRSNLTALFIAIAVATFAQASFAQPKDGAPVEPAKPDKSKDAGAGGKAKANGATEATTASSDAPASIRLRSLEQRVQSLKERAWRAKARVGMLKEAVLGGGVGARASITHHNEMGSKFRLIRLVYALDGKQVFSRSDDSGKLHESKRLEVLTGPIAPGSHTISVVAIYRGHGYGVFRYYNKYKFTVKSSHSFTVEEGKGTSIKVRAFERGGMTTPMEKRPGLKFKVSVIQGGKR